jgi:hypothetical protein
MRDPASGNVARFVRSARSLLAFQLLASAGAVGLTAWAVIEVQQLVEERDDLRAQLVQREGRGQLSPADEALIQAPPPPTPAVTEAAPARPTDEMPATANSATPVPPPPPPALQCKNLQGSAIACVPPFRRVEGSDVCIDGNRQKMSCPAGVPFPDEPPPPPPPPPAPERNCRNVFGKAIVCVPPFRQGPVDGVCIDGRNRPVQCPPGEPKRQRPPNDQPAGTAAQSPR